MNTLQNIVKNIQQAENLLLFTHQNPDYDAYGSTAALHTLFLHLGKTSEVVYALHQPKLKPRIKVGVSTYNEKKTIDLSRYDYALCLDSSYGPKNILGLNFQGKPKLGVGIIDHHTRGESAYFPEQDANLPTASSTCEIIYNLIDEYLIPFQEIPSLLKLRLALYLLRGILDDMVGLTIVEKTNDHNLAVLRKLKTIVGSELYQKNLTKSRTLRLPVGVARFSKYLKHYLLQDETKSEFHGYLLSIPEEEAELFAQAYSSSLLLFDHYARMSCEKNGWQYGLFLLTIDGFETGMTKVSARGPIVKQVFRPIMQGDHPFVTCGISGESAFGGKVKIDEHPSFGTIFFRQLKISVRQQTLYSAEVDQAYLEKQSVLDELNNS